MKTTDFTLDGKAISYELADNGYTVYLDGNPWIEQYDNVKGQFGKPVDMNKSYEEYCLEQIEEICTVANNAASGTDEVATLKAQVEYLAMMSDVDLSAVSDTDTSNELA